LQQQQQQQQCKDDDRCCTNCAQRKKWEAAAQRRHGQEEQCQRQEREAAAQRQREQEEQRQCNEQDRSAGQHNAPSCRRRGQPRRRGRTPPAGQGGGLVVPVSAVKSGAREKQWGEKACESGAARTVRRQAKAGSYHVPKGRRAQACVREEREENGAREKQ